MAVYNELQAQPHPDADLFLKYPYRYLKIVTPVAVFCEMTPPHLLSDSSHEQVAVQLQQLGYHVNVADRLPSCYCGDYTHRDRWFAIGFINPGPSYNLLEYCTTSPLPAVDILDPACTISDDLIINEPHAFRKRGHDTHPWGGDQYDDPQTTGQYISRSTVAGYLNDPHDKEDKFYLISSPMPVITRFGVQLHDTRISTDTVRFATLRELCQASNLAPEQIAFLHFPPFASCDVSCRQRRSWRYVVSGLSVCDR